MIKINGPILTDAPPHCEYFFNLVKEDNLIDALEASKKLTIELTESIPHSKENYSYAPGKWPLKSVFSHLPDCERYYTYYVMCFSRKDHIPMINYDIDLYALNANTSNRTMKEISEEYLAVREATMKLFSYMTDDMLDFKSNAIPFVYTPRSLGWMTVGHNIHHLNLIREKYLKEISDFGF